MKTIVMFQAHATTLATLREYRSISEAVAGIAESRLLLHSTTDRDAPCSLPRDSYVVTDATLAGLGYPQFEPGVSAANVHFPLLQFFAEHSSYDFYWLIQYDVRFTGSWRDFFQAFLGNTVDFLTSHIREYADEPNWHLWRLLHHPKHYIPYSKRVRSFNPVCRMSRSALVQLEESHRSGWAGHFEVLVPTLLRQNGASLQDLGGCGKFVPEEARNCFYVEGPENANGILDGGTLRSDPVFQEVGPEKNKLFHPVRPVEFILPPAINSSSVLSVENDLNASCDNAIDVHVIHLPQAEARRKAFLAMNQVEGVNCVFVEGVDSRRLDLDELKRQNLIEAGTTFRLPGIALAHRNLWLKAASMQKALIVCEDDAVLRKDFHNQLARCLATLPDDWKFLLLGYNFDSLLDVYIIDRVEHFEGQFSNRSLGVSELRSYQDVRLPVGTLRLRNAFGAPGYAVSPNGAQFLIANVFPLRNRPVTIRGRTCVTSTMDALLNGLYAEMRAYVCVPPLVVTPNEKDPTVRTVRVA